MTEPEKLWAVLDQDSTVYAAAHPRACHEHINDAIDNDVQDAGKMVVREYVSLKAHNAELARLRAEVERAHNAGFVEASRIHGVEIERLRAEVESLRENNHGWLRANGLGGWIDALRADAERWRAMQENEGDDCRCFDRKER